MRRAGFTYGLSRLKPRALEKMRGSSRTTKTYFLVFTDVFSEKTTSTDMKTFFFDFHRFLVEKMEIT